MRETDVAPYIYLADAPNDMRTDNRMVSFRFYSLPGTLGFNYAKTKNRGGRTAGLNNKPKRRFPCP
jgi:hypothetical protein